jgi:hypothetical protein
VRTNQGRQRSRRRCSSGSKSPTSHCHFTLDDHQREKRRTTAASEDRRTQPIAMEDTE